MARPSQLAGLAVWLLAVLAAGRASAETNQAPAQRSLLGASPKQLAASPQAPIVPGPSWGLKKKKPPTSRCPKGTTSSFMYGCNGERWKQFGPLADFSNAGYHQGGKITRHAVKADVRKFGAKGDGVTDDTLAVKKAIKSIPRTGGVVFFGRGRYVITRQLIIQTSNTFLRGKTKQWGEVHGTALVFPKPLSAVYGRGFKGSWIEFRGQGLSNKAKDLLARATSVAHRGATSFYVSSNKKIKTGTWVVLVLKETKKGELVRAMLGASFKGNLAAQLQPAANYGKKLHEFSSRVLSKGVDKKGRAWIHLARPLPLGIPSLDMRPKIYRFVPSLTEVGLDTITLRFPWTPYLGLAKAPGYNMVRIIGADSWYLHQVDIIDADISLEIINSRGGIVTGVNITTSRPRGLSALPAVAKHSGNIGISLSDLSTDNDIQKFNITGQNWRDITIGSYSCLNVVSNARGTNLKLDMSAGAPHNNLFSKLNLGSGSETLKFNAPLAKQGPAMGSGNIFWNIVGRVPLSLNTGIPRKLQGFNNVVVGTLLTPLTKKIAIANGWVVDRVTSRNHNVVPLDLFGAMHYTRSARLNKLTQ